MTKKLRLSSHVRSIIQTLDVSRIVFCNKLKLHFKTFFFTSTPTSAMFTGDTCIFFIAQIISLQLRSAACTRYPSSSKSSSKQSIKLVECRRRRKKRVEKSANFSFTSSSTFFSSFVALVCVVRISYLLSRSQDVVRVREMKMLWLLASHRVLLIWHCVKISRFFFIFPLGNYNITCHSLSISNPRQTRWHSCCCHVIKMKRKRTKKIVLN